jgi:hypothetical protein
MIVQINDDIPLVYRKIQLGLPVSGLSVTVTVYDGHTGEVLLPSTALSEVFAGFYRYIWSGGLPTKRHCLAVYTESDKVTDEFFDVEDTESDVAMSSGRTT